MQESKKKRKWWHLPVLLALAVATIIIIRNHNEEHDEQMSIEMPDGSVRNVRQHFVGSRNSRDTYRTFSGTVFGTIYNITYQGRENAMREVLVALDSVDRSLSMFNSESNLSRINRGETTRLDAMTREVLTLATEVSRQTDGAFDVTVAPLVNAWGFGTRTGELPDSVAVDSMLRHVGWRLYAIEGDELQKADSLLTLDCGAIAKGYGCDVAARALERQGISNYLVEIGGEMTIAGVNKEGKEWSVGISSPNETDVVNVVSISNCGIATSGNYRNYYVTDEGQTISHTIDPRTGYPARSALLSATVIAETCMEADAYATAFMTMGIDSARAVVERQPQMQVLFIYEQDGRLQTYTTPTLQEKTRQ